MVRDTLRTDKFLILPYPFLRGPTVGKGVDALAVRPAVPELPDILVATGIGKDSLAVIFTIPKLPDVLVAVGKGIGALAVRPTGRGNVGITRLQATLSSYSVGKDSEDKS
jgi:hypothetical protein